MNRQKNVSVWFAWAWANGVIEMGTTPPKVKKNGSGCIVFAKGQRAALQAAVATVARHGYSGVLLVPGVVEAKNGIDAIHALGEWVDWCASNGDADGVVFSRSPQELML